MFLVMIDEGEFVMPALARIAEPPALPSSTFGEVIWRGRLGGGPAAAVATTMAAKCTLKTTPMLCVSKDCNQVCPMTPVYARWRPRCA
jgi:hypothetical protein